MSQDIKVGDCVEIYGDVHEPVPLVGSGTVTHIGSADLLEVKIEDVSKKVYREEVRVGDTWYVESRFCTLVDQSHNLQVGDFVEVHGNGHKPTKFVGLGTIVEINANNSPKCVRVNIQDTTDCEYCFPRDSIEEAKEVLLSYDRWIVEVDYVKLVASAQDIEWCEEEALVDLGDIDDPV